MNRPDISSARGLRKSHRDLGDVRDAVSQFHSRGTGRAAAVSVMTWRLLVADVLTHPHRKFLGDGCVGVSRIFAEKFWPKKFLTVFVRVVVIGTDYYVRWIALWLAIPRNDGEAVNPECHANLSVWRER